MRILLVVLLATSLLIMPSGTQAAVGDTFAEAETAFEGNNSGSLSATDDVHYFFLSVSTPSVYQITLSPPVGMDFDLYVYDVNENFIDSSTIGGDTQDVLQIDAEESIYIQVYAYSGSGPFTLNIQNEGLLAVYGLNTGYLAGAGEEVYYQFNLQGSFRMALHGDDGTDFDFQILDSNNQSIGGATGTTYPDVELIDIFSPVLIRVYSFTGTGYYTLDISNYAQANLGPNNGDLSKTGDDFDFFFTGSNNYDLSLTGSADTDFDFIVYDSSEAVIGSATSISYPDTLNIDIFETVRINVFSYSGSGSFTLDIQEYIPEPTEIEAFIGDNPGTLDTDEDTVTFVFNPASDGFYDFDLYGPEDTDFDMTFYDSLGNNLGGAYSTSYPDSETLEVNGEIFIDVYSFFGSGAFNLIISEGQAPVEISSFSYSDQLSYGDIFVWNVTSTYDSQEEFFRIQVEVLENDLVVNLNEPSSGLFEVTYIYETYNDTTLDDDMFPLILFTSMSLTNGSTLTIDEVLQMYMGGIDENDISQTDTQLILTTDSLQAVFDLSTGILLSWEVSYSDSSVIALLESSSFDLGDTNDDDEEEEESSNVGIDLSSLPFDGWYFVFALIAIPIVRRTRFT